MRYPKPLKPKKVYAAFCLLGVDFDFFLTTGCLKEYGVFNLYQKILNSNKTYLVRSPAYKDLKQSSTTVNIGL